MRNNFQIWVNAVCQEVRFRPDRRSIELELHDHYEDHLKDLLRLGRDRELAEERALEAMGNPQEVGWALDRVHKPWLGWLWEASRVLALLLALLLVWKMWQNDRYTRSPFELAWNQFTWAAAPSTGASRASMDYLDLCLAPGEPEAYRDIYEEAPPDPGETRIQVPLTLWVETKDVFHDDLVGLYSHLNVVSDSRPLHYGNYVQEDGSQLDSGYWYFSSGKSGWTRYRWKIILVLDSPPRRVDITHPQGGWTLTAEWEGAA